jgi:hypothetical protein
VEESGEKRPTHTHKASVRKVILYPTNSNQLDFVGKKKKDMAHAPINSSNSSRTESQELTTGVTGTSMVGPTSVRKQRGIKSNQIYSLAVTGPTNQKPQKPKIKTKHIKNEENQSTAAHL